MYAKILLFCLVMHQWLVLFCVFAHSQSANILGVFIYPSLSQQNVFQAIWRELALRGHQVTVLTTNPLNDSSLTNLKEVSLSFLYHSVVEPKTEDCYVNPYQATINWFQRLDVVATKVLNSTQFKGLITKKSYDLILLDYQHPVMYALAEVFSAPTIAISSEAIANYRYDAVGNPNHPTLFPDPILNFHTTKLSLWQKFQSIGYFVWSKWYYHHVFVPRTHQMATKHFGDDIPYIGDLERQTSLFFISLNPVFQPARANVPAIVDIGQIHIQIPKPLPNDLKVILDNAKQGVILFSPMLQIKSTDVGKELLTEVMDAISEMPYTFLIQWKTIFLPFLPKNILIRESLPQQDVLAHPNVKAFVTLGDLQSIEEAIARKVPMIGIPFTPEQDANVQKIEDLGIGKKLISNGLTKTVVKDVVTEVAEVKKFKTKVRRIQKILFDRLNSPLEDAIWWSEYVIRYKGAKHLKSPAVDMSYIQYLLLDVILFLIAVSYVTYKTLVTLLRLVFVKKIKTD